SDYRNRASDEHPLVDDARRMPVSAATASATMVENAPGGVRNGSPETIGSAVPPCRIAISPTRSLRLAPLCKSLKRIEMRALARSGIRLCAGLPPSRSVISRLDGWIQPVHSTYHNDSS